MAEPITNYKCPNCTGPLRYAGDTGQVECEYCGTKFETGVIEQIYADKDENTAQQSEKVWDIPEAGLSWSEEEKNSLRLYNCPSCGANLICDETTAATSCPYCGNPTIIPAHFAGDLKPDYVIPFRLEKEAAVSALKEYYKGKRFLPNAFAEANHIEEIKGIYVPFWLYDGTAAAKMRFRATRVHSYILGDYNVTETEHYRLVREGSVSFQKIPVDASQKMPDAHMDSVEPFDYNEMRDFSTAYLPGYMADKYDMDSKACWARANDRIKASTEQAMNSTTAGYTTIIPEYQNINLTNGEVKYALLPVWLLSTKWNGTNYLFAMNGQTGKLIGDLPVDKGKYWAHFAVIAVVLMAALGVILFAGGGII
jgi:DNA-directed RNA polymerase subunit RPC12/RpoP